MEFKGTKKEWKRENNKIYIDSDLLDSGKLQIAVCLNSPTPVKEANAKLIASAPELLNDLKDLYWLALNEATSEEIFERIIKSKQTINKALK